MEGPMKIGNARFVQLVALAWVGALLLVLGTAGCGGGTASEPAAAAGGSTQTVSTDQIDAQAMSMAAQILAGGTQTGPALQQALLATGFTLQAPDGSLTQPTAAASQGMLLTQWDADVMTLGTNNGGFVTLADLAAAMQLAFPELDTNQISANLLAGIADSAQSDQPTVRLWARLIVELGRQGNAPYDLLDPNVDPTQVELNPVQLNLVVQRFIGDLMGSLDEAAEASTVTASAMRSVRSLKVRALADSAAPCTLTDTQQMIMDKAAMAEKKGFSQLIKYLESKGVAGAGTAKNISGRANAVLTYVKLLASLLAFNEDFSADLSELVRTWSTVSGGQQMKVTVTVKFDNGNAQLLNCVRQVGNLAGIDFQLTPTGPIKNAEIIWYLLKGDTQGIAGTLGYLRWAKGSIPNVSRFTDVNGQDTITVEGAPQKKVLVDPHSVEKPGQVHAKINLKSANIVQDLLTARGGAGSLPAEMIYRTGLGFERSYNFTVVDWEDCTATASAGKVAGKVATKATIQAANTCSDSWTGTASFTLGGDPATGVTTSASVTWVLDQIVGNVAHYRPTGTASFAFPNCTVSPSSESMSTDPGGGTGGELAIDFSTDPPTYRVMGSTVWQATYCGGAPAGAGGMWVGDPATFQFVSGPVAVSKDPQTQAEKVTISGAISTQTGSSTWQFTKD